MRSAGSDGRGLKNRLRDRLRANGLFREITSWKLRRFVPIDTSGAAILAKVLERVGRPQFTSWRWRRPHHGGRGRRRWSPLASGHGVAPAALDLAVHGSCMTHVT